VNINEQCAFYESIGFAITAKYTSPNAYAVMEYDDLTLHFWGSKKNNPLENASMTYIEVTDVDYLNKVFCVNIKSASGKVPRTGFPRISKVRELKEDKRFTLTDLGGNTIYFGTPNDGKTVEARTLENGSHAKAFAVVYDLLHSHEEPEKASKALLSFMRYKDNLSESDLDKLVALKSYIEQALDEKDE
jgi:hypothetical protein